MDVPAPDLISRLLASEIAYTATQAVVIGRWAGNPFGVETRRDDAFLELNRARDICAAVGLAG